MQTINNIVVCNSIIVKYIIDNVNQFYIQFLNYIFISNYLDT